MKTDFVIPGVPPEICADTEEGLTAALLDPTVEAEIGRARAQFERGRPAFVPGKDQPRDAVGKFRKILARLKFDIGDNELANVVNKIKDAETASALHQYSKSAKAGRDVITLVDKIKDGTLDPRTLANVREGTRQLAKVLAYLPLPKGDPNSKVRFTDLPPATIKLIQTMISKVQDKIGMSKAEPITAKLNEFITGVRSMSSDEMATELNRLLALLI